MTTVNPASAVFEDASGNPIVVSAANPLPTTIGTGGDPSEVVGSVAHDSSDAGNPVKIGGYGSTTAPTAVTAGDRVNAWYGLNGEAAAFLVASTGTAVGVNTMAADGLASSTVSLATFSFSYNFNGTTFDRGRSIINGTDSVGTGIQAVGLVAQFDNTSPTAITENQFGNVRMAADRSLHVKETNSFLNIVAGQATTVVKASAGTLHSIVFNSAATATNTTIIYDHPSGVGTVIGRPAVTAVTSPDTVIYDLAFANGLTIITATANGGDMTVVYS